MGFAEPNTGFPDGTLTTSNSPRTVGGGNARLFVVAIYGQMKLNFCVTAQHHDHNHLAAAPLAHVTSRRRSGHRFALSQSRAPTPRRFPLLTKREKGSLPR